MKRCTLYTCFIRGIIRRLILRAIVHKKENHGSIVVGKSRKFTSSFLTVTYRYPIEKLRSQESSRNILINIAEESYGTLVSFYQQRSCCMQDENVESRKKA